MNNKNKIEKLREETHEQLALQSPRDSSSRGRVVRNAGDLEYSVHDIPEVDFSVPDEKEKQIIQNYKDRFSTEFIEQTRERVQEMIRTWRENGLPTESLEQRLELLDLALEEDLIE